MEDAKDDTQKLFEAVKIGQTENIKKYLALKANINATDEDGLTPLHIATKLRKFVVQKQLLFEKANPKLKDNRDRIPLHYAAEHGDVETIKLLMAHDIKSIKFVDGDRRTPLHIAAIEEHEPAVDLFVYCGASGKAKDAYGDTPKKLTKSDGCKKLLNESRRIVDGFETGDVKLGHKELRSKKTYKMKDLGLTLTSGDDLGSNSLSLLCRRIRPEFSGFKDLGPIERQLLISDIYDFRISGIQFNAPVDFKVPIFKKPPPYEEICIKTNTKLQVDDSTVVTELESEGNDYTCKAHVDITKMKAFVLLTRRKWEHKAVDEGPGSFISDVDSHVKMEFEEKTFDGKGTLSLNMTPSIADKEDHNVIVSTGMFYDIKCSEGQPKKDVTVTTPLPFDYQGEGKLVVLNRENDPKPDQAPSDVWKVVPGTPEMKRGRTTFKAPHFSVFFPLEVLEEGFDLTRSKQEAEEIFQKSMRKEKSVVFMAMIKTMKTDEELWFSIILEVLSPLKIHERKNNWFREGYGEVKGAMSKEFDTYNGCSFKINVGGNSVPKSRFERILQYHHHRDNYFVIHLKPRDPDETPVAILDMSTCVAEEELEEQYGHQTQLEVLLVDTSRLREDLEFKGFTRNPLLRKLATELEEEDQWVNVSLYLGVHSEAEIATSVEDKFEALVKWRDRCKHKINLGLPTLVLALRRTDREDLVDFIQEGLQKWLRDPAVEDKFLAWLKRKQGGLDAEEAAEFPEPMSDEFLKTLARQHGEELYQLAHKLDISPVELEDIKKDVFCTTDEHRVLEFLCTARDKQGNNIDAFEALLDAFKSTNMDEGYSWSFDVAQKWVEENVKQDNEYAVLLEEFLEEIK